MNYEEAFIFLNNSLMYTMSLGSKELFHSNVWWYLIKNDQQFIKVFVNDFKDLNDFESVYRESYNRDIVIFFKNQTHITIENKIKTLPNIEQLEKYSENIGKSVFKYGVLTGIGNCSIDLNDNRLGNYWSYKSYEEIADGIESIAKISENMNIINHIDEILEYCKILRSINVVLNYWLDTNANKLIYDSGNLWELRINDIFKKLKGSTFFNYIKSNINIDKEFKEAKKSINNLGISYWQGFNNGKCTLNFDFYIEKELSIGVQIEGEQFRIFVQRYNKNPDVLYEEFKELWFDDSFDCSSKQRKIFSKATKMKPNNMRKYDKYVNNYTFIYQYFDISSENHNQNYDELLKLIRDYILKALDIFKKIN